MGSSYVNILVKLYLEKKENSGKLQIQAVSDTSFAIKEKNTGTHV